MSIECSFYKHIMASCGAITRQNIILSWPSYIYYKSWCNISLILDQVDEALQKKDSYFVIFKSSQEILRVYLEFLGFTDYSFDPSCKKPGTFRLYHDSVTMNY